jgi:cytochrome b
MDEPAFGIAQGSRARRCGFRDDYGLGLATSALALNAGSVCVLIAWFTPNRHDGLHRFAGYTVIGLLLFRLAWGLIGTRHSRFRRLGARLRAAPAFVRNVCRGRTGRYLGLNPAGVAMMASLLLMLCVSTLTGAMQVTVRFFGAWWIEDTTPMCRTRSSS